MFKIETLIWVLFWRALKFQCFSWRVESSKNIEMDTKLILSLCMNYRVHVFSTMWRIKNQPANSTSCSNNALRLLVVVACRLYWGLQVMSSFSIWVALWRVVLKEVYFEGPSHICRALKTSILNIAPLACQTYPRHDWCNCVQKTKPNIIKTQIYYHTTSIPKLFLSFYHLDRPKLNTRITFWTKWALRI